MAIDKAAYQQIITTLGASNVQLIAVSKTKSVEEISELYELGQRDFGENYIQELQDKQSRLPADIRWHFIGHLQSNKVKQLVPFVQLIQSVDSLKLLEEINKQAAKAERTVNCLLQVYIAAEDTKFGMDESELNETVTAAKKLSNVSVCGLMGMASFTDDMQKVRAEFRSLKKIFDRYKATDAQFNTLSMGMSHDHQTAIEEGATMVRIGSLLFGTRESRQ